MVRGRKPEPTNLKLLKGARPSRINKSEPKPTPTIPACPCWLPLEAKRHWRSLVKELDKVGIITVVDRGALAAMCLAWSMAKDASDAMKVGLTIKDANGVPRKNPAHQILRDSLMTYKTYCVEFGLTPSSRGRLSVPGKHDEDEMDRLLGGGF